MKKVLRYILNTLIIIFALIGVTFTAVFVGMQFGLTNVRGTISERNAYFGSVPTINHSGATTTTEIETGCSDETTTHQTCAWNETSQWQVVKGGLSKDAPIINRVAQETGVNARMIAAAVVPEQMRFFSDNREVFKRYFEPLKILASLSQFSLGVSGIKQKTADTIEEHAGSTTSPFYPGPSIAPLIAYATSTSDHDVELFNRLTDEKNHYYSYLYTAIYLREISAQWERAGYDVHERPDVLVTLFNLGFNASEPKSDPKVAGAAVTIGGQKYSYGHLGANFYYSDELLNVFPR